MSWSVTIPPVPIAEFEDTLGKVLEDNAANIEQAGAVDQATELSSIAIGLVNDFLSGDEAHQTISGSMGGHVNRGDGSAGPSLNLSLSTR